MVLTRSSKWVDKIQYFASFSQTPVSIAQMVAFGQHLTPMTLLKGTQFVHRELPIRLAKRVVDLENLPDNLSNMPSILRVKEWYTESFIDLMELPEYKFSSKLAKVDPQDTSEYFIQGTSNGNGGPVSEEAMEYVKT